MSAPLEPSRSGTSASANDPRDAPLAYLGQALCDPLSVVLAVSERLASLPLGPAETMLVDLARANISAAGDLIDQVAVNTGLGLSSFGVASVDTPLESLLVTLMRSLSVEFSITRHAPISVRFNTGVPGLVNCDPIRLRHIVSSLIRFAAGHTDRGDRVRISISVPPTQEREAASQLIVTIDATGLVLDVADAAAVMGHLPAGEATAAHRALVASHLLMGAVGATLDVDETDAGWARFRLCFPFAPSPRVVTHSAYGRGRLMDREVLVVDPDDHARGGLCLQLSAWRMTPAAASDSRSMNERMVAAGRAGRPFQVVVLGPMPLQELASIVRVLAGARAGQAPHIILLQAVSEGEVPLPPDLTVHVAERIWTPVAPEALQRAVLAVVAPSRPAQPLERDEAARTGPARRVKILIAEDNAINQLFTARMLQKRGYLVSVANNGADVLDALETASEPFDVVLMDIQMPVLDGVQTTEILRARERRGGKRPIPIVAVTAHAMHGERERFLAAGMDAYIPKPVVEEHLLAAIEAVLPHVHHPPVSTLEESVLEDESVFDAQRILDFVDGDREFLTTLVELFVTTSPTQVAAIGAAVAAGDPDAVNRTAHQLKGSVGNFAAERAKQACYTLETMGRQGDLTGAHAAHSVLVQEIDTLCDALRDFAEVHG